MKCPTDGAVLVMSERSGIEIDYCPECRGIWLDRGELDKIIEKAVATEATQSTPTQTSVASNYEAEQAARRDTYSGYERPKYQQPSYDQGYSNQGYSKKKKRKHWLEELFD